MQVETVQTFLGWNLLIHTGFLMFIFLLLTAAKSWVVKLHQAMFELTKEQLERVYFSFIATYKLLIVILFLVPYLVVRFLL